jgi:hypothetical protein
MKRADIELIGHVHGEVSTHLYTCKSSELVIRLYHQRRRSPVEEHYPFITAYIRTEETFLQLWYLVSSFYL